jgi:hypothetical protein
VNDFFLPLLFKGGQQASPDYTHPALQRADLRGLKASGEEAL